MLIIKHLLTPAFVIVVALLLGLQNYGNGMLFKSLIILSAMPVGFNALIPINIYGLDLDLGNSCWIVSTLSLVVIVPALYLVISA
jgi:predicted permease